MKMFTRRYIYKFLSSKMLFNTKIMCAFKKRLSTEMYKAEIESFCMPTPHVL